MLSVVWDTSCSELKAAATICFFCQYWALMAQCVGRSSTLVLETDGSIATEVY